jgi:hypothetical protein
MCVKIPRDHPKIPVSREFLHLFARKTDILGAADSLSDRRVPNSMRPNSPAAAFG